MSREFSFFADQRLALLHQTFHSVFWQDYQTELQGGANEPEYIPASGHGPARIVYTEDYFSSALHEIAHWCVAGDARRLLNDYGYWYHPDGRSAAQQAEFERVEVKPQAIERIFSCASCQPFRVSADNLAAGAGASGSFSEAIHAQTQAFCIAALPARAKRFALALAQRFSQTNPFDPAHYTLEQLL